MLGKLLGATVVTGLLSLSPYSVGKSLIHENTACATEAVAAPTCRSEGCIGGNALCADLPSGTRCYTTIIIEIEVPADGAVAAAA